MCCPKAVNGNNAVSISVPQSESRNRVLFDLLYDSFASMRELGGCVPGKAEGLGLLRHGV